MTTETTPAPHTHFAIMRLLEEAFTKAVGGGIGAFRTSGPDDAGRVDWFLNLANGGTVELRCVGGSGNGGGGPLGQSAETIVYGPAPAPTDIPDVPVTDGKVRVADVEAWIAAVVTNAAPVDQDGRSWLKSVERYSLRPEERRVTQRFGLTAHLHSGGGTYIYFPRVVAPGQQLRGGDSSGIPDAV